MQTCSRCNSLSPDEADACLNCGADLGKFSTTTVALERFRKNSRVTSVRISMMPDACPACREHEGVYSKDNVPSLPAEGCSHGQGCRCFYAPILSEIYP